MAYEEVVARKVRRALGKKYEISERKMFGGIAFMLNGNMCCGVIDDKVMLRLGKDGAEAALKEDFFREMDFTGRSINSMVYLTADGHASEKVLKKWVGLAAKFAASLPPK